MAIVRWQPFHELETMRQQMDRLVESFWGAESLRKPEPAWAPACDIIENKDEIVVKVEVPGMNEKDLSLNLSGDNLIIKGERKSEKDEQDKDKSIHRIERWYGSFQRVVPLPVSVDAGKIKANYQKGVLEVHLPKKPEVKPKEIPISVV